MSFPNKAPKSGFVIKLSSETVQKLQEDEAQKVQEIDKQVGPGSNNTILQTSHVFNPPENYEVVSESRKTIASQTTEPSQTEVDVSSKKSAEEKVGSTGKCEDTTEGSKTIASQIPAESSPTEVHVSSKTSAEEQKGNNDWGEHAKYVIYEGDVAVYREPTTNAEYTWSKETNDWIPRNTSPEQTDRVYSYENDTHIYTEADGSKFFWDAEKNAWFPKVDDDFLAIYQLNYGFVDNVTKEEPKTEVKEQLNPLKRKVAEPPKWFEPTEDTNTKVYVSNLPLELTEDEFIDFMQKCGLVMRDPSTQKMKIKLYRDTENDCFKGDALCTYIKIESVELALNLLDGSDLKGNKIKVERAHFQMKGEYNPALKPKKKKKKEIEKIKRMQEKLFDWRPEKMLGEKGKNERVVIVKNLFHPSDFDKDVQLILDYQQDLREECNKCGEVRKIVLYDRHPEGVAQITMAEPEQADAVIVLINGRWFGKRQIEAHIWDGRTKYKIAETEADINKRLGNWEKFLEDAEGAKKKTNDGEEPDKNKEKVGSENTEKIENEISNVETPVSKEA